jgi:diketogulonate reductase-like aldo/keto reductase
VCAELGLAFLPWSPLGGIGRSSALSAADSPFARIGRTHDISPQQVCLAWELQLSPVVIPIPGASRPESIVSSAAAVHVRLTAEEMAELSALS